MQSQHKPSLTQKTNALTKEAHIAQTILLKLLTHTYMQMTQRRESLHYQRMIIIHSRDMWMSNIIASQMMVKQMINNISVVMYRQHTS